MTPPRQAGPDDPGERVPLDRRTVGNTARTVRFTGLLSAALSTGVFFGTRAALGPSTKAFAPKTYVEVQQATIRNLRPVMGPLLPGAVAANLAVLALSLGERRSPAFALALIGSLSMLASLILTGLFELPINARVLSWSTKPPGGLGGDEGPLGGRPHGKDRHLGRGPRMPGGRRAGVFAFRSKLCVERPLGTVTPRLRGRGTGSAANPLVDA